MPAEPIIPVAEVVEAEPPSPPLPATGTTTTTARRRSMSTGLVIMESSMLSSRSGGGLSTASRSSAFSGIRERLGLAKVARRTLGILCLAVTVLLWTVSNFLASDIFSDNTFSKPFFVVYINSSIFAFSLIPMAINYVRKNGIDSVRSTAVELWREQKRHGLRAGPPSSGHPKLYGVVGGGGDHESGVGDAGERLLADDDDEGSLLDEFDLPAGLGGDGAGHGEERLDLRETAWLSLEFSMLWFLANYLASACLEYTSVASVTILTSTSSVWTLVFGYLMRVEGFTVRKLAGVLASLAGVVLISTVDLSGKSDENRGNFPHKSQLEVAIGDSMAFVSSIVYGFYVIVMKRKVGNEERVNMPLFFGMVGLFNLLLLWPIFIILHLTSIETFELPPTGRIWLIIVMNSLASFVSDMSWAYAMLLTTPLVVTVGLSLTIPFSLVGEMIQYHQYSSWVYWIGACVVLLAFLVVNHASHEDEEPPRGRRGSTAMSGAGSAVV